METKTTKTFTERFDEQFVSDDGLMHDKYAADEIKEFFRKELKQVVERIESNAVMIHKGELRHAMHGWLIDLGIIKLTKKEYGL